MSNSSWLEKILPAVRKQTETRRNNIPEGLWRKCPRCEAALYRPELERNLNVCPKCDHHLRLGARTRLALFLDDGSWPEIAADLQPTDPLKFKDSKKYKDRLLQAQKSTGEKDALVAMAGELKGMPVVAAAFEFRFMGGSMGSVVGARFTAAVDVAIEKQCPFVCFAASGGARMQEALFSLMQMAKTSAALARLREAGLPYISVLTDPVYGGVTASLAMLGDVNVAEPNALIGFAGTRVIEQTVRQKLPEGFQRSEFLLEHGTVDMIVHRNDLGDTLHRLLSAFMHQPLGDDNIPLVVETAETDETDETAETTDTAAVSNAADNTATDSAAANASSPVAGDSGDDVR